MAIVPSILPETTVEGFLFTLGKLYITTWQQTNQKAPPSQLDPLFVGFFIWYNFIVVQPIS